MLDRIAGEVGAVASGAELILEIGAGRGPLTRRLASLGPPVVAIEIDHAFAKRLRAACPTVEVVVANVLDLDLARLIPGRAVVAGNLPYYITSPIVRRLCEAADRISAAILLVQREVAERICARPGSSDFGFLSVLCQSHARAELLFVVPPGAFRPPPKVFSAVVRLTMHPRFAEWGVTNPAAFFRFAESCFHHKRKTLLNNLEPLFGRETLRSMPEAPLRAEQLSAEQLASLFLRLTTRP